VKSLSPEEASEINQKKAAQKREKVKSLSPEEASEINQKKAEQKKR